MTDFFADTNNNSTPYICVDLSEEESLDPSVLEERIESLGDRAVDAVNLPLYRTQHLVSLVHCPDEAAEFRDRQLSRDEIIDLQATADNEGLTLSATVYDPDLLQWYDEAVETPFVCFHGGDITYRRLLERASESDRVPVLSTAAATGTEIERALDWLGDEEVLLQFEPIDPTATSETTDAQHIGWLADKFGTSVGYRDRSGVASDGHAALLNGLELWMPVLTDDGYDIESLNEQLETLKTVDSTRGEFSADPDDQDPPSEPDGDVTGYRKNYRRSLMASRSLSAGDTLGETMIRELRPGSGLPAENVRECIGIMVQRPTDPQEMIAY